MRLHDKMSCILEEYNQADISKECPSRQIAGRSRTDGAILP